MRYSLILILMLTIFVEVDIAAQCNPRQMNFQLNNVEVLDDSNCPGGSFFVRFTVSGDITGGNPSFCVGYIPVGGTINDFVNSFCWDKVSMPLTNETIDNVLVPCNAVDVGLVGYASPNGQGNMCTDPPPSLAGGNPLPISLLTFTGTSSNEGYSLFWQTATEIDNDYFAIERSDDAIDFETIGMVPGAGNSHNILSYEFTDENPSKGINYYRLTQYDFDGQSSSSDIIVYENLDQGETQINVLNDRLKVYTDNNILGVGIFGLDGRLIQEFIPEKRQTQFDISNLRKGLYVVTLTTDQGTFGQKVMVR